MLSLTTSSCCVLSGSIESCLVLLVRINEVFEGDAPLHCCLLDDAPNVLSFHSILMLDDSQGYAQTRI